MKNKNISILQIINLKMLGRLIPGLALLTFAAVSANAVTIDFDQESDFTNNFTVADDNGGITYSTDPGVGGVSGRLNTAVPTGNGDTLYYDGVFDLNNGPITTSFFFLADAYTNNGEFSRIALGISATEANLQGNVEAQARLLKSNNTNTAVFQIRDANPGATSTSDVSLTENHWYLFSATYSVSATANSYDITASLDDYGTTGTTFASTIATASGTRTQGSLFSGGDALPVNIGILPQNAGGGAEALDNFTAIPELGTTSLYIGFIALVTLGLRKKLRK